MMNWSIINEGMQIFFLKTENENICKRQYLKLTTVQKIHDTFIVQIF